jgi:hypothetical protein
VTVYGNPADGCETRWQAPFPCSCPGACNDGDTCTDDTCKPTTGCKNTRRDRCGNGACEGAYESTCACADCGPDQDGDNLPDRWETFGLDTDCNGTPDYQLPGADPTRRNVYVELDYFKSADHSHALTQESVDLVVAAFARKGIILRIDVDEALRHREVIRFDPRGGEETCSPGSDWVNFDNLKKLHFDPRKRAAYRYAIFGHYLNCLPTTTLPALGKAEGLGNDFVPTDKGAPVLFDTGPATLLFSAAPALATRLEGLDADGDLDLAADFALSALHVSIPENEVVLALHGATLDGRQFFGRSAVTLLPDPGVADEDQDGVPDVCDACPGSPLGMAVAGFGCPQRRPGVAP